MTGSARLEDYFLPLSRRTPSEARFVRVIGYDRQGTILSYLKKIYALTRGQGVYRKDGISNPTEPEIQRFFQEVGESFILTAPLIERHLTVWLGQLRPAQRKVLAAAVSDTLGLLKQQGANENICKNAYIKFMCWLRGPFGGVLKGVAQDVPPKVLYEGSIGRYELLFLNLLYRAGCDVLYVDFCSEDDYTKAARGGSYGQPIYGDVRTPPPVPFTCEDAPAPAAAPAPTARPVPSNRSAPPAPKPSVPAAAGRPIPPQRSAPSLSPPPWAGMEEVVLLNSWAGDASFWDAALLPCAQRKTGKLCALFSACFGADDRAEYRNRLFRLKRSLDASGKKWVLIEGRVPPPTNAEAAVFRSVEKTLARPLLIRALADKLASACGKVQALLAQRAFSLVMERFPEKDAVRFFNYGVRLACWLKRYAEQLFAQYRSEHQPAVVYYGPITEAELSLLWALAQTGVDVLCFCPSLSAQNEFETHFLPHDWQTVLLQNDLPMEPFPQREERMRASTTAYDASRELDHLLYSDTGMFRDRQFVRSQPVTLKTTYDEVGQLWREEAQYRPSFRTEGGVVYVPNLFSKISGVDKGDLELYWNRLRGMVTEDTYLVTTVPFLYVNGPSMSLPQARSFLHDGHLDPNALKKSRFYRYDYLPDDTQDYLLEKIQALIDYDLIVGGGPELPASMLSVLMNLNKELLRLVQNFDFTKSIPKFLIVDVTESVFTLEECILLAFLNLVGFDIAVFTPTGYRNLEKHLRPDSFDTLTAGEFFFDLVIPDLRSKHPSANSGGWFGRLFGANRS